MGKTYDTNFYSLEAIIAVGYRVNSERGTQFRQWAITILKEYIHKGFALDSDRFNTKKFAFELPIIYITH